jgi:hypothetical protein
MKKPSIAVVVACGFALIAGCVTAPKPLEMTSVEEVSAVVTALDLPTRSLTLKGPAGNEFTVIVDQAVRNLPQVQVGDKVVARYYESIGADLRKANDPSEPTIELADAVAEQGKRPAGLIGTSTTVPVTIVAVDTKANVVRFYGADKRVREIEITRPAAQAYVRKLKAGDQVVVTFTEALAVSVEPVK